MYSRARRLGQGLGQAQAGGSFTPHPSLTPAPSSQQQVSCFPAGQQTFPPTSRVALQGKGWISSEFKTPMQGFPSGQWLRLCLPKQEVEVQSLVWELRFHTEGCSQRIFIKIITQKTPVNTWRPPPPTPLLQKLGNSTSSMRDQRPLWVRGGGRGCVWSRSYPPVQGPHHPG